MKKEIAYSIIPLLGLTSCWFKVNHRRNIIVPGHFSGVDEYDESVLCDLWIEPVSKEEYKQANGVNVIRDEINRKHYSIRCNVAWSGSNAESISFANFKDAFRGSTDLPISYVDENRWWLSPDTEMNSKVRPASECTYTIEQWEETSKIYAALYYAEAI